MGEKPPFSCSTADILLPDFTAGASTSNNCRMWILPTVLTAILSDCNRDTPLPCKVPRVRAKRATSYLNITPPANGIFSTCRSTQRLPLGVAAHLRNPHVPGTNTSNTSHHHWATQSPAEITILVMPGKASPISSNRVSNCGTTKPSITNTDTMATTARMAG